jgi:hypothetical protein
MKPELLSYVLQAIQPQFLDKKAPCPLEKPSFLNGTEQGTEYWKEIFQIANQLMVLLPLAINLSRTDWRKELPEEIQLLIDERIHREKMILAILDHELDSALFLLINADIPVLVLKGMDWGRRYYSERILRSVSEIDLLIPKGELERAKQVLKQGGYQAAGHSSGRLARLVGGPALQLHTTLFSNDTDSLMHQIWQRSLQQIAKDLPVHAHALSHEDNLIFLIKHCTTQNLLSSPIWLNDLHYLFQNKHFKVNADWDWLVWYFAHHHLISSAWFILNFLNSHIGTELPKEAMKQLGEYLGPMKKYLLAKLANPKTWFSTQERSLPWTFKSQYLIQDSVFDAVKFSLTMSSSLIQKSNRFWQHK